MRACELRRLVKGLDEVRGRASGYRVRAGKLGWVRCCGRGGGDVNVTTYPAAVHADRGGFRIRVRRAVAAGAVLWFVRTSDGHAVVQRFEEKERTDFKLSLSACTEDAVLAELGEVLWKVAAVGSPDKAAHVQWAAHADSESGRSRGYAVVGQAKRRWTRHPAAGAVQRVSAGVAAPRFQRDAKRWVVRGRCSNGSDVHLVVVRLPARLVLAEVDAARDRYSFHGPTGAEHLSSAVPAMLRKMRVLGVLVRK
eukprot:TRINITY_DN17060_c0_g1_i1.p1 TRINITY_DN17060_c0_g1~~TRINITY_DN17060_c0_g1_i1.p1  ORF type:complete len:270 (+),score=71.40 TRINITY_DN17060_c0_g1_i1:57-812(+)